MIAQVRGSRPVTDVCSRLYLKHVATMEKYISVKDLENVALSMLSKSTGDYYKSGATDEQSLAENRDAFKRLRIRPKCLVGVGNSCLNTTVLGQKVSMPIGIAPSAMQRMAHPDGELANVRAAQAEGTIYTLSTIATSSIEEVSEAAPNAIKWFQLYIYNDREVTKNLVLRAEKAGFKAIALTVDTPLFGIRRADIRNNFTLPSHLRITNLPIVAKGIMRADDAIEAVQAGCSGILVSNHGARQLDGTPATIEVLPEIVEAVKSYNVEVYLDGGVTTGTDVYKALALGARMVFVGRPALWGLTVGGQAGVQKMLQILRTELQFTVQIAGTPTISDIKRDMVCHESVYSKL
ncbi:2-Hydroxyacid oxidase 1 isoform X3 [Leguminivora glycinivorella]|uniref:2-Hydroxyacid oxidase 1 isoform X3 n=1 Tax=Leguminivora glycinivorella TaxID=1035111 RepID=UPI00200EB6E3|nr:2-Hydroxyacid oxidase 1 isoform X3 [Leguminivora glycinivorella]